MQIAIVNIIENSMSDIGSKSLTIVIIMALWTYSQVENSGTERSNVHLRTIRGNL